AWVLAGISWNPRLGGSRRLASSLACMVLAAVGSRSSRGRRKDARMAVWPRGDDRYPWLDLRAEGAGQVARAEGQHPSEARRLKCCGAGSDHRRQVPDVEGADSRGPAVLEDHRLGRAGGLGPPEHGDTV